jgi:formate/nitrite transporter FocA (FNT family)
MLKKFCVFSEYAKLAEEKTGVKAGLLALGVGFTVTMLTLLVCGQEFFTYTRQ